MDVNAEKQNGLTDNSHHLRRRRRSSSSGDSDLVVLSVVFNKKKQKQNDEVAIAIERLRENGVNCVLFTMNDFRNGTRKPETALPDAFRLASGQLAHSSPLCQELTREKGLSKLSSSLPMLPLPTIKCEELSENSNGSTDSTTSSNVAIHQSVEKVINSFSPSPSPSPPPLSPQILPLGEFEQEELRNGIKSRVATSLHALLSPLLPPTLSSNEAPSSSSAGEPKLQDIQVCSSSSVHKNNKNSKKRRRRVRKPYTHRKAQLKKKLKEIAEVARAARAAQRAARLAISQVSNYNGELVSSDSVDAEPISSSDQVKRFEDCQSALLDALKLNLPSALAKDKHFSENSLASDDVTSNGVDPCLNGNGRSSADDDDYFPAPDSSSKIGDNLEQVFKGSTARKRRRGKQGKRSIKKQQQLIKPLSQPLQESLLIEETINFDIVEQNGFGMGSRNHDNVEGIDKDAILEGVGLVKKKVPKLVNPDMLDLNYVSIDINVSKDEPLAIASLLHKKRAFSPDIIRGIRRINTSKLVNGSEVCRSSNISSCSNKISDIDSNGDSREHVLIKRTKIETPNCVHTETISEIKVSDVQDRSENEESSIVKVSEPELEPLPVENPIVAPVSDKKKKKRGRRTGLVVRKYEKSKKKVVEKKLVVQKIFVKKCNQLVAGSVEDSCHQPNRSLPLDFPNNGILQRSDLEELTEHLPKLPTSSTGHKIHNHTAHNGESSSDDSAAQTSSCKLEVSTSEIIDLKPKVCIDPQDDMGDFIPKGEATLCTSQKIIEVITYESKNDQSNSLLELENSCVSSNFSLSEQERRENKPSCAPVSQNGPSNTLGFELETALGPGPEEPTPGSDDSLPATPDGMQLRRSNFYSLISDNVRKNMENYLDGRQLTKMMTKRRKRTKNTYLLNHGDNYPEDPEAPYKLHLATQVLLKLNKRRAKCKPKEDRGKSLLSYLKLVPKRPPRNGKPATVSPTEEIKEQSDEPVFSGEWTIAKNYICHVCGQVEAHFWDMVMHKGEIHPGVVVTHTELNGHVPPSLVRFSQEETPIEDELIPPCTKCAASFSTIPDLHRHIFECAGNAFWLDSDKAHRKRKPKRRRGFKRRFSNTPKSTPKKSKKSEPKRRPSEVFKCEFCPREFKTEGWLKNHLVTHTLSVSIPLEKLSLPSRASNNSTSCRLFKQ